MELTNGKPLNVLIALFVLAASRVAGQQVSCSRQDYDKCVKIADPLMKDPHLIFPDNMADIDLVCRRWSQFVDCVKRYTDRCFTEVRRQDFNKAIASPVDSVHQMCTDSSYQKEYLQYATCIKSTLIKDEHCGRHYKHLVEQVAGEVSRVTLCCSHHRFRECVLIETRRECDKGKDGGSAARFSRQILDKALSFIKDQCYNYIPSSGYCPGVALPNNREEAPNVNVVVPDQQHGTSDTRPWQPNAQGGDKQVTIPESNAGKPWLPNTRTTEDRAGRDKWTQTQGTSKQPSSMEDKHSSSIAAWLPTRANVPQTTTTPGTMFHAVTKAPSTTTPDLPAGESRPSSYGRGMSWTPTNTEPADWLTKTWKVTSQDEIDNLDQKHKTDTWRPNVAGFGGGFHNQVDEPNQQGLANKNSAVSRSIDVSMLVIVVLLVALNGVVLN